MRGVSASALEDLRCKDRVDVCRNTLISSPGKNFWKMKCSLAQRSRLCISGAEVRGVGLRHLDPKLAASLV